MEEHLKDLTWKQATTHVYSLNTIATLVYHINYYLNVVSQRIQGQLLDPKHELSFSHPPIKTQKDWEDMLTKT
jgi:hypothetical protein